MNKIQTPKEQIHIDEYDRIIKDGRYFIIVADDVPARIHFTLDDSINDNSPDNYLIIVFNSDGEKIGCLYHINSVMLYDEEKESADWTWTLDSSPNLRFSYSKLY